MTRSFALSGNPGGILQSNLVIFWKQRYSFLQNDKHDSDEERSSNEQITSSLSPTDTFRIQPHPPMMSSATPNSLDSLHHSIPYYSLDPSHLTSSLKSKIIHQLRVLLVPFVKSKLPTSQQPRCDRLRLTHMPCTCTHTHTLIHTVREKVVFLPAAGR